jgi:hypothetical protein
MATTSREQAGNSASLPDPLAMDGPLHELLDRVTPWLTGAQAIVLGGSHASAESVWIDGPRGRVCLSDVDLFVVARDAAARTAIAARAATELTALEPARLGLGLIGPVELGVHTPEEWERLPARPGTLELRRHGLVLRGDPTWRERLPDWSARDVSAEEIHLLLENRAFELIAARWPGEPKSPLTGLEARHATYKTALDLAGVMRLSRGEWEDGAEARVRAARAAGSPAGEEPPWDAALAWRRGVVPPDRDAEDDWWLTARAWVRVWRALNARGSEPWEFERVALAAARRSRLLRRARLALQPESHAGRRAPLVPRLAFAVTGTPQHRLNASAGAFLAAVCEAQSAPASRVAIERRLARVLSRLGAVRPVSDPGATARELVRRWESWILEAPDAEPER